MSLADALGADQGEGPIPNPEAGGDPKVPGEGDLIPERGAGGRGAHPKPGNGSRESSPVPCAGTAGSPRAVSALGPQFGEDTEGLEHLGVPPLSLPALLSLSQIRKCFLKVT